MNNMFGLYKGICTNDNDPEGMGRVKAICPGVFGDQTTETDWAWACVAPGAPIIPPQPTEAVWLTFEQGDTDYPIWIGTWAPGIIAPPNPSVVTTIVETVLGAVMQIGHVLTNATLSTNPGAAGYFYHGVSFGTWSPYAAGRVVVGVGTSDQVFSVTATGGESTHLLIGNESGTSVHGHTEGTHGHTFSGNTGFVSSDHTHSYFLAINDGLGVQETPEVNPFDNYTSDSTGGISDNHFHAYSGTTSSNNSIINSSSAANAVSAHNNLQPYIVAYKWVRIA